MNACVSTRRLVVILNVNMMIPSSLTWLEGQVESSHEVRRIYPLNKQVGRYHAFDLFLTASISMPLHPGNIVVHPVLKESPAFCSDLAMFVKQPIPYMDECLGLAKGRNVKVNPGAGCQR